MSYLECTSTSGSEHGGITYRKSYHLGDDPEQILNILASEKSRRRGKKRDLVQMRSLLAVFGVDPDRSRDDDRCFSDSDKISGSLARPRARRIHLASSGDHQDRRLVRPRSELPRGLVSAFPGDSASGSERIAAAVSDGGRNNKGNDRRKHGNGSAPQLQTNNHIQGERDSNYKRRPSVGGGEEEKSRGHGSSAPDGGRSNKVKKSRFKLPSFDLFRSRKSSGSGGGGGSKVCAGGAYGSSQLSAAEDSKASSKNNTVSPRDSKGSSRLAGVRDPDDPDSGGRNVPLELISTRKQSKSAGDLPLMNCHVDKFVITKQVDGDYPTGYGFKDVVKSASGANYRMKDACIQTDINMSLPRSTSFNCARCKQYYDPDLSRRAHTWSRTSRVVHDPGPSTNERATHFHVTNHTDILLKAASVGNVQELAKCLEDDKSLASLPSRTDVRGNTALHVSAAAGHLDCVRLLVARSPGLVHSENRAGDTAAATSIQYGQIEILDWFLDNTDFVKECQTGSSRKPLLHLAAKCGQDGCLRLLLERIPGIQTSADKMGNTAAHLAAKHGNITCLQTLIEFGLDVTQPNHDGCSPCFYADFANQRQCAGFLVVVEACAILADKAIQLHSRLKRCQRESEGSTSSRSTSGVDDLSFLQYEDTVEVPPSRAWALVRHQFKKLEKQLFVFRTKPRSAAGMTTTRHQRHSCHVSHSESMIHASSSPLASTSSSSPIQSQRRIMDPTGQQRVTTQDRTAVDPTAGGQKVNTQDRTGMDPTAGEQRVAPHAPQLTGLSSEKIKRLYAGLSALRNSLEKQNDIPGKCSSERSFKSGTSSCKSRHSSKSSDHHGGHSAVNIQATAELHAPNLSKPACVQRMGHATHLSEQNVNKKKREVQLQSQHSGLDVVPQKQCSGVLNKETLVQSDKPKHVVVDMSRAKTKTGDLRAGSINANKTTLDTKVKKTSTKPQTQGSHQTRPMNSKQSSQQEEQDKSFGWHGLDYHLRKRAPRVKNDGGRQSLSPKPTNIQTRTAYGAQLHDDRRPPSGLPPSGRSAAKNASPKASRSPQRSPDASATSAAKDEKMTTTKQVKDHSRFKLANPSSDSKQSSPVRQNPKTPTPGKSNKEHHCDPSDGRMSQMSNYPSPTDSMYDNVDAEDTEGSTAPIPTAAGSEALGCPPASQGDTPASSVNPKAKDNVTVVAEEILTEKSDGTSDTDSQYVTMDGNHGCPGEIACGASEGVSNSMSLLANERNNKDVSKSGRVSFSSSESTYDRTERVTLKKTTEQSSQSNTSLKKHHCSHVEVESSDSDNPYQVILSRPQTLPNISQLHRTKPIIKEARPAPTTKDNIPFSVVSRPVPTPAQTATIGRSRLPMYSKRADPKQPGSTIVYTNPARKKSENKGDGGHYETVHRRNQKRDQAWAAPDVLFKVQDQSSSVNNAPRDESAMSVTKHRPHQEHVTVL